MSLGLYDFSWPVLLCNFMPGNWRDLLQQPSLNGLNSLPLEWMLRLYLAYCHGLSPSSEGEIDEYFEGKMRADLHTKTRPVGTFELSMVNQQYKGRELLW